MAILPLVTEDEVVECLNPGDFNVQVRPGVSPFARKEGTGEGSMADNEAEAKLRRLLAETRALEGAQAQTEAAVQRRFRPYGKTEEEARAILGEASITALLSTIRDDAVASMLHRRTRRDGDLNPGDDARELRQQAKENRAEILTDLERMLKEGATPEVESGEPPASNVSSFTTSFI